MTAPHAPWPDLPLDLALGGGVPVHGPRHLWGGPLDVEGLAVGSVAGAARAAQVLAARRGLPRRLTVDSRAVVAAFDSYRHLRVDGRAVTGFAPLSAFFAAADGWVRTHANYPHHRDALLATLGLEAGAPDDVAAVARAIGGRAAREVEADVVARGGIAAAVRTPEQWHAGPGRDVGTAPLARVERAAVPSGPAAALAPTDALPLSGLRVLDLTRVIAGPTATRVLGALGADVVRVDPPGRPEILDQHLDTGFAKRSAAADLADPDARAAVEALLTRADVVVSGYRPGALARHGLDADALLERHPNLVVAELSAWGPGPWAGRRGFDSIVQAASGIAHTYGRAGTDGPRPGALPVQALDHAAGYLVAAAVMALLAERAERGGAVVRVSLARVAHELLTMPAGRPASDPPGPARTRRRASEYGEIEYVPPPLLVDGEPLDFPTPPARYGTAPPAWW